MKVFISWSGNVSKRLGEAIRDWLPGVLQLVNPYFTPADIEKGGRWANDIAKELSSSEVGILCVTRDNIHSDWLLFEAGALSKSLEKSYVCPILFGINNADLAGPLKQFQTTEFTKIDFHKLIAVINSRLGDNKLPSKTLDSVFEKWWPDLEERINEILSTITIVDGPLRADREIIEEILALTRANSRPGPNSVSVRALEELLTLFIELHNLESNSIGGYQDSLDMMKNMVRPLYHVVGKTRPSSEKLSALISEIQSLSFEVEGKSATFEAEGDIPF